VESECVNWIDVVQNVVQ